MASNWWDEAPVVQQAPQATPQAAPAPTGADWWSAAPVIQNGGAPDAKSLTIRGAGTTGGAVAGDESAAVGRGLINGVPIAGPYLLGGVNRLAAGVRSLQNGTPFSDELKNVEQFGQNTAAQNPGSTTLGEAGGAGLSMMAMPGEAVALVGSMPARLAASIGTGGVVGAADSAVRGQDPVSGGVIGAGFGAAGPLVGKAAGGAYRAVAGLLQRPDELQGVGRLGTQMLAKGFAGETPESVVAAQQRIGPSGFVGEINPALTDLTGGIADTPGAGKAMVRQAYADRNAGSMDRHDLVITNAFGPRVDMASLTRDTMAARSAAADPLYAAWRSTPVPQTPALDDILAKPSVKSALPGAERMAGDEGATIYDGQGGLTAQGWDYIKRATDDQAKSYGYGTNGFRIANGISRQITSAIDNHPDPAVAGVWQQARQAWSDPTSIMNARELGQSVFSKSQRPDELVYEIRGLSQPERQAFLQGARDHVQEIMGATTRGDTTARNTLLAPNNQAKLRTMLGQDAADELTAALHQEASYRNAAQNVVGGSQTAPKAERVGLVSPDPNGGALGYLGNLQINRPSTYLPISPTQMAEGVRGSAYERARAQIAPLLTSTGPQQAPVIDAVMRQRQIDAAALTMAADPLARAVIGGGQAYRQQMTPAAQMKPAARVLLGF